MAHSSHSFHLKYFLDRNCNVFVWNYRGYGLSNGTPSPSNLKTDIDIIFKHLRNEIKVTGKMGVFGRSLGGIPSSHLAERCDFAVIDRTFASLDAIARFRFGNGFASLLFKIASFGWQAQSDERYLKAAHCYKVMMLDTKDTVVNL